MATQKEVIINGVKFTATFNNSKELSQSIDGLDDAVLINMTRTRWSVKGTPYVKLDSGEVLLGNHFMTKEEKQNVKAYVDSHKGNGGSTGSSHKLQKDDSEARAELYQFLGTLTNEQKAGLQAILSKYFPSEEEQKVLRLTPEQKVIYDMLPDAQKSEFLKLIK